MASINDVAKQAGVSVATVSKVLNNYTDVSEKTKKKVREAIRELKYQPNVVARSLVKGRSWTVGIYLTVPFTNPFIAELLQGVRESLANSGYDLVYLSTWNKKPDYSFVEHCYSRNVDGVVVFGIYRDNPIIQELLQAEFPSMFVDSDVLGKRTGYITADNRKGILQAMEHLFQLGHRKIAYITGGQHYIAGQARFDGYQTALRNFALPYKTDYVEYGQFTLESGREAVSRLLRLTDPPTAVICDSDIMAIGAIHGASEMHVHVPRDLSVVGFDNIEYSAIFKPRLTTVNQHISALGSTAVEQLIQLIENPNCAPPVLLRPIELIVRESTAPPQAQRR